MKTKVTVGCSSSPGVRHKHGTEQNWSKNWQQIHHVSDDRVELGWTRCKISKGTCKAQVHGFPAAKFKKFKTERSGGRIEHDAPPFKAKTMKTKITKIYMLRQAPDQRAPPGCRSRKSSASERPMCYIAIRGCPLILNLLNTNQKHWSPRDLLLHF